MSSPTTELAIPLLDELYRMTARPDQRVVIRDVDWSFYERLVDSIPPRAYIHVDYDGKDLEIMSPGPGHDDRNVLLRQVAEAVAQVLRIPVNDSGFLPIRAEEVRRWLVDEDSDDEAAWAERLNGWVAAELAPRPAR